MKRKTLVSTAIAISLLCLAPLPPANSHNKAAPGAKDSALIQENNTTHNEAPDEMKLIDLAAPLGAATFTMILLTAGIGLLMHRNRPRLFKWHRRIAVTTVLIALCHATIVFITHY